MPQRLTMFQRRGKTREKSAAEHLPATLSTLLESYGRKPLSDFFDTQGVKNSESEKRRRGESENVSMTPSEPGALSVKAETRGTFLTVIPAQAGIQDFILSPRNPFPLDNFSQTAYAIVIHCAQRGTVLRFCRAGEN
jgi:hypothetical protein